MTSFSMSLVKLPVHIMSADDRQKMLFAMTRNIDRSANNDVIASSLLNICSVKHPSAHIFVIVYDDTKNVHTGHCSIERQADAVRYGGKCAIVSIKYDAKPWY